MKRTVGVERTYFISDYNVIKPMESLVDIPEELAMDENFVNKVRFVQILSLDLTFKKYLVLKGKIDQLSLTDAIAELERLKANATDEIYQILNKEK
jgi:hypothetical protein